MGQDIQSLISKYHSKGLLIDANLLLLFCIGAVNPDYIRQCKRTQKYVQEDFHCLVEFMGLFTSYVTTPNILTEVSNLATILTGKYQDDFRIIFSQFIIANTEEYQESKELATMPSFFKFGLTDAGIIHVVQKNFLLITDDFPLSQFLSSQGVDVVNFNHLRILNWE